MLKEKPPMPLLAGGGGCGGGGTQTLESWKKVIWKGFWRLQSS